MLEDRSRSSRVEKARRMIVFAAEACGCEARFVSARRDSNVGRRSRVVSEVEVKGEVGVDVAGVRRLRSGGIAVVIEGVELGVKMCDGLRLMRSRARAWEAEIEGV